MYVDFLSSALEGWGTELSGSALIDYSLARRIEMLKRGSCRSDSACKALAVEVAYDRALISLCVEHHISASVANFDQPWAERVRLEHELAAAGIDLIALSRRGREA